MLRMVHIIVRVRGMDLKEEHEGKARSGRDVVPEKNASSTMDSKGDQRSGPKKIRDTEKPPQNNNKKTTQVSGTYHQIGKYRKNLFVGANSRQKSEGTSENQVHGRTFRTTRQRMEDGGPCEARRQ